MFFKLASKKYLLTIHFVKEVTFQYQSNEVLVLFSEFNCYMCKEEMEFTSQIYKCVIFDMKIIY